MKIVILLLCFFSISDLRAQTVFEPDSVTIEYAPCKGDSAQSKVRLINRGSMVAIFDLRFSDSTRTWEIYDSTGGQAFVKGIVLPPGDTIAIDLRHRRQITFPIPSGPWFLDTLITSGMATSDTLLLSARVLTATLHSDIGDPDLGMVIQGSIAAFPFRVWSEGDVSQRFDGSVGEGWRLEGIQIGDTLMPGDTIDVRLVKVSTSEIGTFTTMLTLWGDCETMTTPITVRVKIVPAHAHWTMEQLTDTVTGCPAAGEYTVTMRNDSQMDALIDSIEFIGQEGLWSIKNGADRNLILSPGFERTLTLVRGVSGTSTRLVIHSNVNGADTLPVTITSRVTIPNIRNYRDTVVLITPADKPLVTSIDVRNTGPGAYRIRSVELEGDERWSVLGLDTITTAGLGRTVEVKLVFSGAMDGGDYPVLVSIRGAECDTLLQQTFIARIEMASVNALQPSRIKVFPTPAREEVNIRASMPFSYELIDLTGVISLNGVSEAYDATISVKHLPRGYYVLRVKTKEGSEEVKIVLR